MSSKKVPTQASSSNTIAIQYYEITFSRNNASCILSLGSREKADPNAPSVTGGGEDVKIISEHY
jgi:hypothetical protein